MLKTKVVKITKENRDTGKSFLISEKPLVQADDLMMRYIRACAIAGHDYFDINRNIGAEGLRYINAKIASTISIKDQHEINALLDECIQIIPSGGEARPFIAGVDIIELSTLHELRHHALYIHTDFLNYDKSQNLSENHNQN